MTASADKIKEQIQTQKRGLIHSFGLFWEVDDIDWHPGQGNGGQFRLLGRRGANTPGLQIADFRGQQGIYILYSNHGPYYTGLTRKQDLGKRLKDHLKDDHAGQWNRFSWFGFRRVLKQTESGVHLLGALPNARPMKVQHMVGDIEALLIRAMALQNIAQMKFASALEWTQIKTPDISKFLERVQTRA